MAQIQNNVHEIQEITHPLVGELIYHNFYNRYGTIKKVSLFYDPAQYLDIKVSFVVSWESDEKGISLPPFVYSDEVDIVDFKHFIRLANERTTNEKKN